MRKRLEELGRGLRRELSFYRRVAAHPGTPWLARVAIGAAVAYVLWPFDLIPDAIPVIGHLDDLFIVPALLLLGLNLVPEAVIEECRNAPDPSLEGG